MTVPQDDQLLQFKRRVQEWSDRKRLIGQTTDAIQAFAELNAQSDGLVSPWPELVAYRLAMLLLRRGERAELGRIDELLTRANRCVQLGPRPLLYLLGVLHRRRLSSEGIEAAELDQRVVLTFEEARSRTLHRDARGGEPDRRLQDDVFNMLELAAVFLGREMHDLEGRDGPFGGLGLNQALGWQILGNRPDDRNTIRYPYELAVCEIEAQRDRDRSLFLVRERAGGAFAYWLPDGDGWCDERSGPPWTALKWALRASAFKRTDGSRQTLKRARDWFEQHLGHPWILGSLSEGLSVGPSPQVMFVTVVSRRRP